LAPTQQPRRTIEPGLPLFSLFSQEFSPGDIAFAAEILGFRQRGGVRNSG
jgi:hypothetical protein